MLFLVSKNFHVPNQEECAMKELCQLAWKKGVLRAAALTFVCTAMIGISSRPIAGFTARGQIFYILGVALALSALVIAVLLTFEIKDERRKHSS